MILGRGLQHDLNRVLGYGVAPASLRGVEQPMARLAASFPVISELRLLDGQGHLLNRADAQGALTPQDRSEEHTSELQSLMRISYAVFCLKKKKKYHKNQD